jgi:hypothetical protein
VCPHFRSPVPAASLCKKCHPFFAGPRRLPFPIAFGLSGIVFGALNGVLQLERQFAADQVVRDVGFYVRCLGGSAIMLGLIGVLRGIVAELGLRGTRMTRHRVERRRKKPTTLPPKAPSDPLPG